MRRALWFATLLIGCSTTREHPATTTGTGGDPALAEVESVIARADLAAAHLGAPGRGPLVAVLPTGATDVVRLSTARDGVWMDLRTLDLAPKLAVLRGAHGQLHTFVDALPSGDLVLASGRDLFEEIRILRTARADHRARYEVKLGPRLAQLRVREGYIEAVEPSGFVAFSAAPPFAVDAHGTRRTARAAVTPAGERTYELRVEVDLSGLAPPLVVDPAWTTVASMKEGRTEPASARLADGRVLVTAGRTSAGSLYSTQIYDAATNTWSDAAPIPGPCRRAPAVLTSTNAVAFFCVSSTAQVYSPATNTWSSFGSMIYEAVDKLPGGRLLAWAGGCSILSDTTFVRESSPLTVTLRVNPTAALATSGTKGWLVGGKDASGRALSLVDVYDDTTKTWSVGPPMPIRSVYPTAKVGPDGRLWVFGGIDETGASGYAAVLDPAKGTWTALPRALGAGLLTSQGRFIAWSNLATSILDPNETTFLSAGPSTQGHNGGGSVALNDGRMLLAGGGLYLSTAEIFSLQPAGASCTAGLPGACATGFCVDGVCCDTSCSGSCSSCALTGSVGTCTAVSGPTPAGRSCGAYGGCVAGACVTACASDGDCAAGHYCAAAACVPKKDLGQACPSPSTCKSGLCVDGVCCDSACTGQCEACNVVGREGTCSAKKGSPEAPRAACSGAGTGTVCGPVCDGSTRSTCMYLPAATTPCGTNTCSAGFETRASTCDGKGVCTDTKKACGAYACGTASCLSACSSKLDCAAGFLCVSNACVPAPGLGQACTSNEECSTGFCTDGVCCGVSICGVGSTCAAKGKEGRCAKQAGLACASEGECATGFCVDGVCCDVACGGVCEACDVPALVGKCSPVKGAPRGARGKCPAGPSGPCAQTVCDGVARDTCAALVGSEVVCRVASCAGAVALPEANCDGKGACASSERSCGAYRCDDGTHTCRLDCTNDAECSDGNRCRDGQCRPAAATCSVDESSTIAADGTSSSCAPLRCRAGECLPQCSTTTDCIGGFVCAPDGTCVAAAPPADEASGCHAARRGGDFGVLAVLAAVACFVARRRLGAIVALTSIGCSPAPEVAERPPSDGVVREVQLILHATDLAPRGIPRGAFRPLLGSVASASMPTHTADPIVLRGEHGAWLSVSMLQLAPAVGRDDGRVRVFTVGDGSLVIARDDAGIEELRVLRTVPERYEARYSLEGEGLTFATDGASLRASDREGRRFLVMPPAFAVDALGTRRTLAARLETVADGRATLALSLSTIGLRAPVVVDPTWTMTTETLYEHRDTRAMFPIPGGAFLFGSTYDNRAERFDVATGTWIAVGSPPGSTSGGFTAHAQLATGSVVVAGGRTSATPNVGVKDAVVWRPTGGYTRVSDLPIARMESTMVALTDGTALLAGGSPASGVPKDGQTMTFDPVANAWTMRGSLPASPGAMAPLPSGSAMAFAGAKPSIYDPVTGSWSDGPTPATTFVNGALIALSDTRLLALRGDRKAFVYDPTGRSWSTTGDALVAHPQLVLLRNGRVLALGATAEVWDPTTGAFSLAGTAYARNRPAAATLGDGRVLVAGGSFTSGEPAFVVEIFEQQPNGAACGGAGECSSGFCNDGVCCDKACDASCVACNLVGKVGTCSPVTGAPAKLHPACAPYNSCVAGTCASSCTSDADCCADTAACCTDATCSPTFVGAYCTGGACVAKRANAAGCTDNRQCVSGFCADGVCCTSACNGACEACAEAGNVGQCIAVTGSPRSAHPPCTGEVIGGDCGTACLGTNRKACEYRPAGNNCSADRCTSGVETHLSTCDGLGRCGDVPKVCGAFACGSTACRSTCAVTADCAAGFVCKSGTCLPAPGLGQACSDAAPCAAGLFCTDGVCCGVAACPAGESCGLFARRGQCSKKDGSACSSDGECGSGACVDGVCCDSPCGGQCQACDVEGSIGKCIAVKGAPRGKRPPCSKGASVCEATSCDGSDGSRCVTYAGSEVTCVEAACTDGVATSAAACNGAGACSGTAKTGCAPYRCSADGKSCANVCTKDDECVAGTRCVSGQCARAERRCTDDGLAVVDGEGKRSTCAPYRCQNDTCITRCTTSSDCIGGTTCTPAGACEAAPAVVEADEGGCTHSGRSGGSTPVLLAIVAGLARRRRSAKRSL